MKTKDSVFWKEISIVKSIIAAVIFSCILFVLDINNTPSYYLSKLGIEVAVVVCSGVLSVIVLVMIKRHLFELFRIPCGNTVDEILLSLLLINVLFLFQSLLREGTLPYKYWLFIISFTIEFLCLIARVIFCCCRKHRSINESSNVIDLCQLFTEQFSENKAPLLFSDEASQSDLLGRDGLVNLLYNSIVFSKTKHVYVIGVKGAWGSGKTTLLNLVKQRIEKNNSNILVIDEFDPWVFGSQEALLAAMYDEILKKIGIAYNSYSNKAMVKKIQETVTDKHELAGIIKDLVSVDNNTYLAVKNMKRKLEVFLRQMNKSIVFFIDNIDRADSDNVLFLFKLIGAVFDLPNIVYVLSYDPKRIEAIFDDTNKINPKYVEKIIQQEITIPQVSEEALSNLCYESIERLLVHYGVDNKDLVKYKKVADTICGQIRDLRQYKRLLNSAFVTTFCYDNKLYKPYLLSVEVIRFLEPGLYEEIKSNSKFFVSRDIIYSSDYSSVFGSTKKFNEKGKEFFNELFEKYSAYKELLTEMFLYVRRFCGNQDLKYEHTFYDETPEESKIASISSAKYFDLYFSFGTNEFLRIHEKVCAFIDEINGQKDEKRIQSTTLETVRSIKKDEQREWFERLQSQIETIDAEKRKPIALGICASLKEVDKVKPFAFLSAEQRALIVVTSLLKGTDYRIVEDFISEISHNENIRMLEELVSDCDAFAKNGEDGYVTLKEIAQKALEQNCNRILCEGVNLYDDEHYKRHNIWSLYRFCSQEDNEKIHAYVERVISARNVFRVIGDVLGESSGTRGYGYAINQENLESLIGNRKVIDDALKEATPLNDSERFVLMIWQRMDSEEKDIWGEKDYYSPIPITIEL